MKDKLAIEVFYPHPPERVWQAITERECLASWLLPTTFKPEIGLQFRFDGLTRSGKSTVQGVVLEVENGRRLVYTWDDGEDDAPGIVAWTLQPTDGGTCVRVEHQASDPSSPIVLIEASANWRFALESSLPEVLCQLRSRRRPPVPMVYVEEAPEEPLAPKQRAGFRQEVASCR